ncbi:MAG: hypothetical protein ACTTKL_11395 [Treponema sp.]
MTNETSDKKILSELRAITKAKMNWNTAIDDVAVKLGGQYSADVKAKALWLLGEMGLQYPLQIQPYLEGLFSAAKIARLKNTASLLIANVAYCTPFLIAFRNGVMQQLPKFILCSVAAF